MFIVILVISNASLLALAAVILRSEFGILNLCILHSDIHFFFFCIFNLLMASNTILSLFSSLFCSLYLIFSPFTKLPYIL